MYLLQEDLEIASTAFSQSSLIDPEYVLPWIGRAFVSKKTGRHDLLELMEHAQELAHGSEVRICPINKCIGRAELSQFAPSAPRIKSPKRFLFEECLLPSKQFPSQYQRPSFFKYLGPCA